MDGGAGTVAGYGARAKVVVAYWSYDYREHAMGHLTRGLFCSHQVSQQCFVGMALSGIKMRATRCVSNVPYRYYCRSPPVGAAMQDLDFSFGRYVG